MKSFTAHLKPNHDPILVRESFSWAALLTGPIWLAIHRAWIPALINLALYILIPALAPHRLAPLLTITLAITTGLFARDLVRWSLQRRGYTLAHVLSARDEETALGRLLTFRPDIAAAMAATLR